MEPYQQTVEPRQLVALVVILRMRALITARRITNLELKRLGSNGGVT